MHVPDRVDIVSDGRGPGSSGGPHRENGVWVAHPGAEPVLVRQVLRSNNSEQCSYVLYKVKRYLISLTLRTPALSGHLRV